MSEYRHISLYFVIVDINVGFDEHKLDFVYGLLNTAVKYTTLDNHPITTKGPLYREMKEYVNYVMHRN